MTAYRIYLVGASGRLQLGQAFEAAGDAEAVEVARTLTPAGQAAELWAGGRILGRFSRTGAFEPNSERG